MVKQQVKAEVPTTDLQEILFASESEIAAQFDEEAFEIGDEGALEVGFGMDIRQVEKVQQVSVFEEGVDGGMKFSHPR